MGWTYRASRSALLHGEPWSGCERQCQRQLDVASLSDSFRRVHVRPSMPLTLAAMCGTLCTSKCDISQFQSRWSEVERLRRCKAFLTIRLNSVFSLCSKNSVLNICLKYLFFFLQSTMFVYFRASNACLPTKSVAVISAAHAMHHQSYDPGPTASFQSGTTDPCDPCCASLKK